MCNYVPTGSNFVSITFSVEYKSLSSPVHPWRSTNIQHFEFKYPSLPVVFLKQLLIFSVAYYWMQSKIIKHEMQLQTFIQFFEEYFEWND